jgi:hypothetical protein
MNIRAYLRFAKTKRGTKVFASSKPQYDPVEGNGEFYPTVYFAVDFDIPDDLFKQAENVVAKINVELKGAKVSGSMLVPEIKKFIRDREDDESLRNMNR